MKLIAYYLAMAYSSRPRLSWWGWIVAILFGLMTIASVARVYSP